MPHQSDYLGPLAKGWQEWRATLSDHGFNTIEIEIMRKMFLAGAHVACRAGAHNPLTIPLMLREVREANRETVDWDA